ITRIEVLGPVNLYRGHSAFHRAQPENAVANVLMGDRESGIDIAAADQQRCQSSANFFEIGHRDRPVDIGSGDLANRSLVEDGTAFDPDPTEHKARRRGQGLRKGRHGPWRSWL